jgi:hypothetical protein
MATGIMKIGDDEQAKRTRRAVFQKIFEGETARDDGGGGASGRHLVDQLADLLLESGRFTDRAHALRFLTADKRGQALLSRLSKAAEHQPKESHMDRIAELHDIMKHHGPRALAKHICESGAHGISEAEFTAAVTRHAHAAQPNLTEAQAFTKLYESEIEIRRAYAVLKAAPFFAAPIVVGGDDVNPDNPEAALAAYNELLALAAAYRKAKPAVTEAQAFDAVFTSKENAALAAAAHRRPKPPANGFYAFPLPR